MLIYIFVCFYPSQLEEHDKALRILVHKLKDYGAAENYCMVNSSGKDSVIRKRLFHALLNVYLDPSYEWVEDRKYFFGIDSKEAMDLTTLPVYGRFIIQHKSDVQLLTCLVKDFINVFIILKMDKGGMYLFILSFIKRGN